ncbi:MAG: hypothetical protein HQL30_07810 [Candidatus Omnitrophica bacterium]|nr:hypothetical protein [Candidatus Omnitrophota bacterium]
MMKMTWVLFKLEKGALFPRGGYWPEGLDAVIPLSDGVLFKVPMAAPAKEKVVLYQRDIVSGVLSALVWLNARGERESSLNYGAFREAMISESYREEHKRPLMSALPFNYHLIPEIMRYFVISSRIKIREYFKAGKKSFPFSMFNAGCEILFSLFGNDSPTNGAMPSLVLTHDVESAGGLLRVQEIAGIEETYGFKSSWNIIPKRDAIDMKKIAAIAETGHEIGLHGIWHNNREAFLAEDEMRSQFRSIAPFIREFSVTGYRSPAWNRTTRMFKVLSEFFVYDSSCLDLDLMSLSGNGGVGFMRPLILDSGLIELPCTLPFEVPLYYGIRPEDLIAYWAPKIDLVRNVKGMLLVNTHPEPNYLGTKKMMRVYGKLLSRLSKEGWKPELPGRLAVEVRKCAQISTTSLPR